MVEARSFPILSTKLTAPPAHAATILRPRLTAQFDSGLSGKLTLISAPPGFGKTTLVTEWLSAYSRTDRVAWLSLDAGDSDSGRFLSYFVSALRTVEPEIAPGLTNTLQAPIQGDLTAVLVDVINSFDGLDEQIICVLDDYHSIRNEAIHEALSYLLEHQPAGLHLVITSRETPPLPLPLLRSRRALTEFRAEDLRFTVEEAGRFLNDVMGLALSPEQIQALDDRTEGWIAGLLLAALAAEEMGEPGTALEEFSGEQRYVFDYLAEEVLRRQPPEIQHFLSRTSILNRMTADLTRALTGEGQERLEYLVEANLFTLPLDNHRAWYRYHHLFGEFLSARYRERDPDGWSEAHHRASCWYENNDFQYEAAEHALESGDLERLADLVQGYGREFVRVGRIPTLERWLSALDDDMIARRPNLILIRIWTLMLSRRYEKIPNWFERIDMSLIESDRERLEFRAYRAVCEATYARFQGDLDEIIERSRAALEFFSTLPGGTDPSECVALLHLGSALRMSGDTQASIDYLKQAIARGQSGQQLVVELNAMSQITAGYFELGDFGEAERWGRKTLEREGQYGMRRLAMAEAARLTLSGILREREEYEESVALLDDAIKAIRATGDAEDQDAQLLCYYTRAQIECDRGEADAARKTMVAAVELGKVLRLPPVPQWRVLGLQAQVALLYGDLEVASRWSAERDFPEDEPVSYPDERAAITRAWIDLEMGEIERAELLLLRLTRNLECVGRTYRLAEAHLVLAAVYLRQSRVSDAEMLVDRAVDFAIRENCRRLLIDTHPDISGMLVGARRRARHSGRGWPYDETGESNESAGLPDQTGLVEPLTARELEVLALLSKGIPNREIAERLYVSIGTVKRHTHNIYGKLGVNNRTQAIIRGQELELFQIE